MYSMNSSLCKDIETVFFMTSGKNYLISSTLVKEIFKYNRDISKFVPTVVARYLKKALKSKKEDEK